MNNNLIIIGAGIYGVVAQEIALSMNVFDKIDFIDDNAKTTPNGIEVIGTVSDLENITTEYMNVIVAIGNPKTRLALLQKIEESTPCKIVSLISPNAYISPSAQIMKGCIIEPMSVIHTGCVISRACIISAGAVINHASFCADGVHVDCNATVSGNTVVPSGTKVESGSVFKKDGVFIEDLFMGKEVNTKHLNEDHFTDEQEDGLQDGK